MRLLKQSSTAQPLLFLLISSTDHLAPLTGASPTVTLSKSGGSFASPSGAVTEIGSGWYKVAGNATDTNTLGPLVLHATATGADPTDVELGVVAFDPQSATNLGLSNVDATISSRYSGTQGTADASVIGGYFSDLTTAITNVPGLIWNRATSLITTNGSIGKYLLDTILTAAGVRAAVGMASANLDTQLGLVAKPADAHGFNRVLYVTKAGNDGSAGTSVAAAKLTVGGAIAIATAGDLILVGPGVFDEGSGIIVPEFVTLRGAGRGVTIVQAASTPPACSVRLSTGATVEDFTISELSDGFNTAIAGGTEVVGATFRDCDFITVNLENIDITSTVACDIRFEGCTFHSPYEWLGTARNAVHRITMDRCTASTRNSSAEDAKTFWLYNGAILIATDCDFLCETTGTPGKAITVNTGSRAFLSNCRVFGGEIHIADVDSAVTMIGSDFNRANVTGTGAANLVDITPPLTTAELNARTLASAGYATATAQGTNATAVAAIKLVTDALSLRLPGAGTIAVAGDAMDILTNTRTALAALFEARLLNDGDGQALLNAIVASIGNLNVDELALVAAIRADLERTGGTLKLVKAQTDLIDTPAAIATATVTAINADVTITASRSLIGTIADKLAGITKLGAWLKLMMRPGASGDEIAALGEIGGYSATSYSLATLGTHAEAIEERTDNLPDNPAAVGSEMTLDPDYDAAKTAASPQDVEDAVDGIEGGGDTVNPILGPVIVALPANFGLLNRTTIAVARGTFKTQPLEVLDALRAAVDLTGRTLRLTVFNEAEELQGTVEDAEMTIDSETTNRVYIDLPAELTAELEADGYLWGLYDVTDAGQPEELGGGPFKITAACVSA